MNALAWDDKPKYMQLLKTYLERFGVNLEIVNSQDEFVDRFFSDTAWDFVVTDLVLDDSPALGDSENVGHKLALSVTNSEKGRNLPIFLITAHYDRLNAVDISLPSNVVVKSKSTYPGWMAGEIQQELKRRGLFVNRKKVFLVYGHDTAIRNRVESFLRSRNIELVTIADRVLRMEIAEGLISRMNECGAFVAICTPDDAVQKKSDSAIDCYQPRPNVFVEIGMALGLSRGLQRLILLQRWGPDIKDQAKLGSDLAGILTIQFEGDVDSQFPRLESYLKDLGIEI